MQTTIDFSETARAPIARVFLEPDEIVVDFFAGGGGASEALAQALGRSPDIAINHDVEAIDMHRANHPDTEHFVEDVFKVDPIAACRGRRVGLAWFSPTCTFFSKARGAPLSAEAIKIRALCWVACAWAAAVKPRMLMLENVEEFQKYGPLHRQHHDDCAGGACVEACRYLKPIKSREGETFRAFVRRLGTFYRHVEWRLLRACDYGAPTTRRRLFMIASDEPIRWPLPTHGPSRTPYRTAAEVIDWTIPCPSIFDRARPLADKTLARVARGIWKFVVNAERPFVLHLTHGARGHSIDAPLPTVTGAHRGELAVISPVMVPATHGDSGGKPDTRTHRVDEPLRTLTSRGAQFSVAVPYLVHRSNGEREGQAPRIYDIAQPLGTIVAQGQKHALCSAFLARHYGGHENDGHPVTIPMSAITAQDHHSLVAAHLAKFYGTSTGSGMDEPAPTVTAGGFKLAQVCAFLTRYNGQSGPQPVTEPIGTLDTTDRYGLVTVTIDGEPYVIVDIGLRMLTPRELYLAQGFPPDYQIDRGWSGAAMTKTAQVRMCGNSVSPPPAIAAIREMWRAA